jgi:hypothetical protein
MEPSRVACVAPSGNARYASMSRVAQRSGGEGSIRWGTLKGLVKNSIRVVARIRVRWRRGDRGCEELFLIYRDSLWGYWVSTAASTFGLVAGSLFSCRLPPHLSKRGACKM